MRKWRLILRIKKKASLGKEALAQVEVEDEDRKADVRSWVGGQLGLVGISRGRAAQFQDQSLQGKVSRRNH